jgi:N-methylhydantoinase A
MQKIRVGVDTGGTFTDFVVIRGGIIEVFKEFSTPARPEEAILRGMARIGGDAELEVIHGSTVATNALLERKGARTALLTTAGFEDVLVIGRQTRRELYNIYVTRPSRSYPKNCGLEFRSECSTTGLLKGDRPDQVKGLVDQLRKEESVRGRVPAVFIREPCLMKTRLPRRFARSIPVSLSSRIMPEYREYERTSTTVSTPTLLRR